MYKQILSLMAKKDSINFITEIGAYHVSHYGFKNNLISFFSNKKIPVYTIILYFKNLPNKYPSYINDLINIEIKENEAEVLHSK